ncbi:hypothetical protein [Escherichia coli]|uniref:hypothetical protein n=1 Tax=Escherichia coli TaxID=562 RepID=UPI0038904AC6
MEDEKRKVVESVVFFFMKSRQQGQASPGGEKLLLVSPCLSNIFSVKNLPSE